MNRPTIRLVEVRARDLQPGDIVRHAPGTHVSWQIVRGVYDVLAQPGKVRVDFEDGAMRVHQHVDLVTIQKENGS